jgi:transcriptional regulator with XRE-family HTH domain
VEAKLAGLQAALDRNRLQQKHVAEALGVSRIAVSAWVHGRSIPTGSNLVRLVEYLRQYEPGIAAEDLLPAEAKATA